MSWTLNRLLKDTGIEYIPGSPEIPGSEGTPGTPAYSYYKAETRPGSIYTSSSPPSGWDTEIYIPLPGGGYQVLRTGGYRYFSGEKAYLQTVIAGVTYVYKSASQEVYVRVDVPAVEPIPATPGTPATPAQIIENYNFGWNAGAVGPATLAINEVFNWRMAGGNVGSAIGLTLSTAPQDYGYTSMELAVIGQSGRYQIYEAGSPIGLSYPYNNNSKFALARRNTGVVEVYVDGGLVHTASLADDVVPDCSLYSGGDLIWDAEVTAFAETPLNSNISGSTLSDAQAVGTAIAVTRIVGPGTAIGVAGCTTVSRGINGQVKVNGTVYVNIGETSEEGGTGGGRTLTDGVADGDVLGATPTFGSGTARGVAGSTTTSDGQAVGDPTTGVGISTNTSVSTDMNMLPLTGIASGPNVADGWTGNYQGDAMNMLPMSVEASGDLIIPTVGVIDLIMVPMNGSAVGVTGEISVSSDCQMLSMRGFASSEANYSQAYVSFQPLSGLATDEDYGDLVDQDINITEVVTVAGETMSVLSFSIAELLQVSNPLQTFYQSAIELLENAAGTDSIELRRILTVAETYNVSSAITFRQALQVAEALVADGTIETSYTAIAAVIGAIALSDNKITGGSSEGATAGVTVQDFGPPSFEFTFTGYWQVGTIIQLGFTTDVGPGFVEYTTEFPGDGGDTMALFAPVLDAHPLVNATFDGTSVTVTAQAPATTVQL